MPGINIFTSNRMEILLKGLAETLHSPLSSPLAREVVIIQSIGMARWISLELANLAGICANFDFSLPKNFTTNLFKKLAPNLTVNPCFEPHHMAWEIMSLLPDLAREKGYEDLSYYLKDGNTLKRFQLSSLIADTFDQYMIFRPEMILEWEKGKENHWQAGLWRKLTKGKKSLHRAALREKIVRGFNPSLRNSEFLPERISVFGISSLPPFYISILAALSQTVTVYFYILNPCREYWSDIVSCREKERIRKKTPPALVSDSDLYWTQGNSILASLGAYGRDFLNMMGELEARETELFIAPEENHLLSCVQSDILNLIDRKKGDDTKDHVSGDDDSIQIHSCHSPLREMEILHDNLLGLFEKNPSLTPGDVHVMTPDIEKYSPYIHAVFGAEGLLRIPYSVSDRNLGREGPIMETMLKIMELPDTRFSALQVVTILESPPVRQKFKLSETDIETIKRWIEKSGIRWGMDAEHREKAGLPAFSENTWRTGLDRLMLGYAMAQTEDKTFMGILPCDFTREEGAMLGLFTDFYENLVHFAERMEKRRTLHRWGTLLKEILEKFFMPDEESDGEIRFLGIFFNNLQQGQEISGFEGKLERSVIQCFLENSLKKEISSLGFIDGKVTFSAMLPMRSVPFRVVCLAGMDMNAYPRVSRPHGFDLMSRHPRQGDRSLGPEDRYVFLEALISAREKLLISYVGQNTRNNSECPPSILVSELLDYLDQGFRTRSGEPVITHILKKHKLQAYHPDYFSPDSPLFSFSKVNLAASRCLRKKREERKPYIPNRLSEPEDHWNNLEVRELLNFFNHPAKYLLTGRLGIYLTEEEISMSEKEPFSLGGLERYKVLQEFLEKRLDGSNVGNFVAAVTASGSLPPGKVGEREIERLKARVESFAPKIEFYSRDGSARNLSVDIEVSGFRVQGRLTSISDKQLVSYRPAKLKPQDRLKAWVCHLLWNLALPDEEPQGSEFISEDVTLEFPPVQESRQYLEQLLTIYREGLVRPLPLFPASSWKYAELVLKKKKPAEESLERARTEWRGSEFQSFAEKDDPYWNLCFRKNDPLDLQFQELAVRVFEPILKYGKEKTARVTSEKRDG